MKEAGSFSANGEPMLVDMLCLLERHKCAISKMKRSDNRIHMQFERVEPCERGALVPLSGPLS